MELLSRSWEAFAALVSAPDVVLLFLRLTIVAALGHLALTVLRNGSAAARHFVATGTLGALLLTPALGVIGGALPALKIPVPEAKPDSRTAVVLRSLDLDAPRPWVATPRPVPKQIVAPKWTDESVIAPATSGPFEPEAVAPTAEPVPARAPFTPRAGDWPAMLALAALVGALVMLARRQVALVATLWVAHRARPIEDARIRAAFERAVARLDVREPVELALTELLDVPAVVAFPSPRLLLPAAALEWDDARLAAVFVHELAHVQRRDGFGFAVGRLATALLWFHPLVWTLARTARQDCERACDDVVLGAGVRASDYADELLAIARGASNRERGASMSLAFARPSSLEGRLLSILRADTRRAPVTRRSLLALGAALVLLLLPLATVRVVAEPYSKDSKWRTRNTTSSRTRTATVTRTGWGTSESASHSACNSGEKLACNKTGESDGVEASGEKSGDEWYEAGKSHYDAKEFEDAGDAYERAATAGYSPGMAWYNAACSWSLAGRKNRAVGALHAAIDNGFDDPEVIGTDEDLNPMHGDRRYQLLVQSAGHAHSSDEGDGVRISHQKKDWKEWKNDKDLKDSRDGESLDDLDPEDASELRSEGISLMRGGEPERAAKMFQRQYAVDSSSAALYNAACAYSIAGDKDRALMYLERSIYAGYDDENHMRRDDDLRAIHNTRKFDELADLAGDLSFNWPANGFDNSFVGPWRMMLPKLQRMAEKHPDAGPAWFNLGLGELRAKHPDASRAAYLRALSLGYRVKTSQYNLACAAAMGGDIDEAFRRLQLSQKAGMKLGDIAPKDDDLEPLHDDPRWDSLMDRIDAERWHDAKPAKYKSKFKS